LRRRVPGLPFSDLCAHVVHSTESTAKVLSCLTVAPRSDSEASLRAVRRALPDLLLSPNKRVLGDVPASRCLDQTLAQRLAVAFLEQPRGQCLEGVEVVDIAPREGQLEVVARDGRRIRSPRVALCAGPWLPGGFSHLGDPLQELRIKKIVALHIPLCPPPDAPVVYFFDEEAFLLPQLERRRWLASFRSEEWDCQPNPTELYLSPAEWSRARELFSPSFGGRLPEALGGRAFCDAYSTTGEPTVTPIEALPGCIALGGCSGSGIRLAPAMAERALELWN